MNAVMKSVWKLSKPFVVVLSVVMLTFVVIPNILKVSADSNEDFYYSIEGDVTQLESVNQFNGEKVNSDFSPRLQNIQYYIVQGKFDKEHSAYKYDYTITKPEGVKEMIVATPYAYDKEQNQMLLEVGTTLTLDELGQAEKEMDSITSTSDFMTRYSSYNNVIQAKRNASFKTIWRDPIKLAVNSVDTKMSYNVSGGKVTSYTATSNRSWLTASGWSEASHSLNHRFVTGGAEAKTYARMQNSKFCVGQPTTYVYYNTNNLFVGSAGISGNVNTYASGGCSSWLSYSSVLN